MSLKWSGHIIYIYMYVFKAMGLHSKQKAVNKDHLYCPFQWKIFAPWLLFPNASQLCHLNK